MSRRCSGHINKAFGHSGGWAATGIGAAVMLGVAAADELSIGLKLSQTRLDFGKVQTGAEHSLSVQLSNTGNVDLRLTRPRPTGSFRLSGGNCGEGETFQLNAAAQCTLEFAFLPLSKGLTTATTMLVAQGVEAAGLGLSAPLALAGIGTGAELQGKLNMRPTDLDFKDQPVGKTSSPLSMILTNIGGADLTISAITPVSVPFGRAATTTCAEPPFVLPPANGCILEYHFTPTQPGPASTLVEITSFYGGNQLSTMIGNGIPADESGFAPAATPRIGSQPRHITAPDLATVAPGPGQPDEALQQAVSDSNGNRYLLGHSYNGTNYDLELLKFDSENALRWRRTIDHGKHDFGYALAVNPLDQSVYAGGYLLVNEEYQAHLLKFSPGGELRWERRYAVGNRVNSFYDLAADHSGVYAVGEHYDGARLSALLVKYDHAGELLWQTLRESSQDETANRVATVACQDEPLASCAVLAAGSAGKNTRGWIERRDPDTGEQMMDKPLLDLAVEGLAPLADGVVVGGTDSEQNWLIMRLDSDLQALWSLSYPAQGPLYALAATAAGLIYATGGSGNGANSDGLLVLIDAQGEIADEYRFDALGDESLIAVISASGQLVAVGQGSKTDTPGNRFLLLDFDTPSDRQE